MVSLVAIAFLTTDDARWLHELAGYAGSGWLSETDAYFGVPWVDHLHHYSAHLLLALVGLHLAGIIVSSWLHRENLVLPMLTGRKPLHLSERAKFEHEHRATAIAPDSPH
jgi:cytochrome b